jgi:hypothetical protein
MEINLQVLKFVGDFALGEGVATVEGNVVATGKLGFARRRFSNSPADVKPPELAFRQITDTPRAARSNDY